MDIMDLASKAIKKVSSSYGKKIQKTVIKQDITRNSAVIINGEKYSLGFSRDEIMPDLSSGKTYYIAGHGSGHKMEDVKTPVYIHAVWIDCGKNEGILWLSADIIGLTNTEVNIIRNRISSSKIIKGLKSVNFSCTHSHSGIDTVGYWGKPFLSIPSNGKAPDYMEMLFEKAKKVSEEAYLNKKEGRLFSGRAAVPGGLFTKRKFSDKHEILTRLRFVPDDGSDETWLINVGAHPNTLGGNNRSLSGEYPYFMRNEIKERTGANVLFGIGALGGMDAAKLDDNDLWNAVYLQGKMFAQAAIDIEDERELDPEIKFIKRSFYLPVDNNVLAFLAILGTMSFTPFPDKTSETGLSTKTEMTYMTLGDQKLLFLPGESFVSTVYGGYSDAETSATGEGEEINARPLAEIAGDPEIIVYGITNDMTGYCVDKNNFILNPTQPYLNTANDRFNDRHYHETNSMGPRTQEVIAKTFKEVVEDFK
ncbi:MAG: hypothetical protein J1E34_08650 [Oscillospiraceae bacterium]|nr:hypothetical protein [Oscillospiraceae bacterium]